MYPGWQRLGCAGQHLSEILSALWGSVPVDAGSVWGFPITIWCVVNYQRDPGLDKKGFSSMLSPQGGNSPKDASGSHPLLQGTAGLRLPLLASVVFPTWHHRRAEADVGSSPTTQPVPVAAPHLPPARASAGSGTTKSVAGAWDRGIWSCAFGFRGAPDLCRCSWAWRRLGCSV